jgi:hypothetical protein
MEGILYMIDYELVGYNVTVSSHIGRPCTYKFGTEEEAIEFAKSCEENFIYIEKIFRGIFI